MAEIECRVVKPITLRESSFENDIKNCIQAEFAFGWILAALLPDPNGASETYRGIFYRITNS
jgi:hypothetical protein